MCVFPEFTGSERKVVSGKEHQNGVLFATGLDRPHRGVFAPIMEIMDTLCPIFFHCKTEMVMPIV